MRHRKQLHHRRARGDGGYISDGAWGIIVGLGILLVLIVVIGAIMLATAFGTTPVDKMGLHYTGGPIQGTHFAECLPPGRGATFLGVADNLVKLPITQRTYIVSKNPTEGDRNEHDVITVPVKGGVLFDFESATYFTLKTDCPTARIFWERICVKYGCDGDNGWDRMLNDYFRKSIESALRETAGDYTPSELYAGETSTGNADATGTLQAIQARIAQNLKDAVNTSAGGTFFCGPTFDRNHPDVCPDFEFKIVTAQPNPETAQTVIDAFAANAASKQAQLTAENNGNARVTEATKLREAQNALSGIYNDPAYVDYLRALAMQACAAKDSGCTLVITSGNTGVNVNTNPQ